MNDGYVVLPTNQVTVNILADTYETAESYRKSLDGTQAILQYRGAPPAWTTGLTLYDLAGAQSLMQTSAWNAPKLI